MNHDETVMDSLLSAHENKLQEAGGMYPLSTGLLYPPVISQLPLTRFQFCTYHPVRLFVTTFNVNGQSPPENLHDWLMLDAAALPDLIVIGLQEMDSAFQSYLFDSTEKQNEWLSVLFKNLPNVYEEVAHVRMTSIFLVIYR